MTTLEDQEFAQRKTTLKSLPVTLTLEHVSPVTRLLEKRKQMLHVQESLDAQKEEYTRKEEIFKRREENLRKKDLELQEALVLFNKFLKENEQKRRRADHRANEEIKKKMKWEREIGNRRSQLEKLKMKCDRLKQQVRKNEKYQLFLQQVYDDNGNHFDEISSIMARHHTLKKNHNDLMRTQNIALTKNERLRSKFAQFKKDQYNTTLSLNNDIASQSHSLEESVQQASAIEERLIDEESYESSRQRLTTQIVLAADNLYMRCRRIMRGNLNYAAKRLTAKEKEKMEQAEIIEQESCHKLDVVCSYLIDLNDIVESISGKSNKGARGKSSYLAAVSSSSTRKEGDDGDH